MFQWCLQIKVKYFAPLLFSLFLTYWIFGLSSQELVPQWHISLTTNRYYPFFVKRIDNENMRLYAVGEDDHFYHFLIHLRRVPRLEPLPEVLPTHVFALPLRITKIKAFDVRSINDKQHLILLCENSSVYALDSSFNIIWQSQVFSKSEGFSDFVEAGFVRFLDTCLSPDKCNTVLVGVSLRGSNSHEHTKGDDDHGGHDNAAGKHLSTVAFDAVTGKLIWHHLPYDYGRGLEDEGERLAPPVRHHWKLKVLRSHLRMEHVDERPWVTYLPFFMSLLPHSWAGPQDTDVVQASLRHHRVDARPEPDPEPEEAAPEAARANVAVVRHERGLEVLDLFTGRPRAHLWLAGGRGRTFFRDASRLLLAALDPGANTSAGAACSLRLIPRAGAGPATSHAQRRWDDVCAPVGVFGATRPAHPYYREDPGKMVPPLVVDRYRIWPKLLKFLGLGYTYRNTKDIITLVSDGTLNSYSSDGQVNWRTTAPVEWLHVSRDIASGAAGAETRRRYRGLFAPTLTRLRPRESPWEVDAVVAAGWQSLAVAETQSGRVVAAHDLPCQPIARPLVVNEHLVVACDSMIVGFHMGVALRLGTFIMVFIGFSMMSIVLVCCLDPKSIFWELVD